MEQNDFKNKARAGEFKWDLGIRNLLPEWKACLSPNGLFQDVKAGLMVSAAALSLSLAIAMGSKVEPGTGLISAIVAGVLCALFGGTRLSVSGPANSMIVLIALIVERSGMQGLLVAGMLCGLIQITLGIFGFGKFVRYIPLPLVAGFTAGIGVIIFVSQLPRALGLPVPPGGDIWQVLSHLGGLLHESQPLTLLLAVISIGITQFVPRLNPKIPSSALAVLVCSSLVGLAGWDVPLVGNLTEAFHGTHIPEVQPTKWFEMIEMSFLLLVLASLESRFSSSAVDKLIPGEKHDSDQEIIGQGLANCAVAFVGGIPVTGVLKRSVLNIRVGAQTRRAALFHGLFVLGAFLLLPQWLGRIPLASLAGVLLSIAISMVNPREVIKIWRTNPVETIIYWVTFATILMVDLFAGVQMGIFAALLIALWNLGQAKIFFHGTDHQEILRVSLAGNVTFMASRNIEALTKRVNRINQLKALVIDMGEVRILDSTGAALLLEFMKEMKERNVSVVLQSLNKKSREVLSSVDHENISQESHVTSESDIAELLRMEKSYDPRQRLLFGVERYRRERKKAYEELFDQLGQQQKPHTIFITCSDSRINPSLITSSEPGELFIVRNVGNIVPPMGDDITPAEGAALEFSLGALGVEEIVICGHTRCGAVKGAFHGIDPVQFPSVSKWVAAIAQEKTNHPEITDPEEFVKVHVVEQAKNILTYPMVRKKIGEGKVRVHCWIYDVQTGEFLEWTGKGYQFELIGPNSLHGNIQALLSPTQSDY